MLWITWPCFNSLYRVCTKKRINPGFICFCYQTISFTLVSSNIVWTVFLCTFIFEQDNLNSTLLNVTINLSNILKLLNCFRIKDQRIAVKFIVYIINFSLSVLMFLIIQVIKWTFGKEKQLDKTTIDGVANLRFLFGGLGTKP